MSALDELDLNVRYVRCLKRWNPDITPEQLDAMPKAALARISGIGEKGVREVKESVAILLTGQGTLRVEADGLSALNDFIAKQRVLGYIVTAEEGEVVSVPSPARVAYDAAFSGFSPTGFARFREGFEAAAAVARRAALPEHYPWGTDVAKAFGLGVECAALAILGKRV